MVGVLALDALSGTPESFLRSHFCIPNKLGYSGVRLNGPWSVGDAIGKRPGEERSLFPAPHTILAG